VKSETLLLIINQGAGAMSKGSSSRSSGIGFVGLLTILFIGLKLTGYISWSWLWVLSPIWICYVSAIFILLIVVLIEAKVSK
jgi:hypothetical protein